MDMHAAYREVGSYRAAEICRTPKTVRRSLSAAKVVSASTGGRPPATATADGRGRLAARLHRPPESPRP